MDIRLLRFKHPGNTDEDLIALYGLTELYPTVASEVVEKINIHQRLIYELSADNETVIGYCPPPGLTSNCKTLRLLDWRVLRFKHPGKTDEEIVRLYYRDNPFALYQLRAWCKKLDPRPTAAQCLDLIVAEIPQ